LTKASNISLGKKVMRLLLVGMLISMLSVGMAFAGTFSEGGSACGAGPHTFTPSVNGSVNFSYYGDSGSYATIYMYGSPYANVYNGSSYVMYTAISNPLTITINSGSGCIYAG
jgi:hypothetical protein